MIVKIWPIKGSRGLKRAKLYIEDNNKVIHIEQDENDIVVNRMEMDIEGDFKRNADEFFIENEENISRVISYMSNEEKVKNKYVSGYMCCPETATEEFEQTWNSAFLFGGSEKRPKNMENETMAFHMVQSFPEELDISDEEVHQCGMELLERIKSHQGIVCSHVHPVVDDDGEVHGKCKHNHILFNAFMQPEMLDPRHPNRVKYNDCRDTYAQLQIWNDEIAIEHGLPIIRDQDFDRTYSWFEKDETKKGSSWKERIRLDVEAARRAATNWGEFVSYMEQTGYKIREGAHVTYTAPDGEHKIRDNTLGQHYTKASLELFWALRNRIEIASERAVKENMAPPLWELKSRYGALTVGVPVGYKQEDSPALYPLPLEKSDRSRETLSTYFNDNELYDISNDQGQVVAAATGQEIIRYLEDLNRNEQERWEQQRRQAAEQEQQERFQDEEERRRKDEEEEEKKKKYSSHFRNSRTRKRYYVDLRDEDGRYRSTLELIFMLAIVVMKNEDGLWSDSMDDKDYEMSFGPTDWKIQNMMDSIHIADEEGLTTAVEVDQRLDHVGAEYSRARSALQKTRRAQEKMEPLSKAMKEYEETKELAERIHALPDGPEKAKLQEQYHDVITRYKKAKGTMYSYRISSQEQMDDFKERYADIQANLPEMQQRFDELKEDYRRLKKLQYNISLAQNAQYCYGPEYDAEQAYGWIGQERSDKEQDTQRI